MGENNNKIQKARIGAKARIILFLTFIIMLIGIAIGVFRMNKGLNYSDEVALERTARGIQSIPGSENPTLQYRALQQHQNVSNADLALKTGESAIPTILSSQAFGDGIEQVGPKEGEGSLGFSSLNRDLGEKSSRGLWTQMLQRSDCSLDAIKKVMSQGATLRDVSHACSCTKLRAVGFQLNELKDICMCPALKAAGYNATQLKENGFSARQLRDCGFNACELRAANFSASELKDAGFSDGELKGAGFSTEEINESGGLPDWMTEDDVNKAGCSVEALKKLRAQGVSAAVIRRVSGCDIDQLKAAGFTAKELKQAGFSAAELKNAGFSPKDLKDAGFSATELRNAGLTPKELEDAGYSLADISTANATLPPGITPAQVKQAGCGKEALLNLKESGVSAAAIKKYSNCTNEQLSAAGFTPLDLNNAGFGDASVTSSSEPDVDLPPGVSVKDILRAGCSPQAIRAMRDKGVSAEAIQKILHCPISNMRLGGFGASELKQLGVSDQGLAGAGFIPDEINAAAYGLPKGISVDDVKKAGCSPLAIKRLREKGVSAKAIMKISGCTPAALKAGGFSAADLKQAGLSDEQLRAAGFTEDEIAQAKLALPNGVSLDDVRQAGCSPDALARLREKGVSAEFIKTISGCSAAQMKAAGFSATQLADAGFSNNELAAAGFSPDEIQAGKLGLPAGVSIADIKNAGCSPEALNKLKSHGVSAKMIKKISGCSAKELKAAGFNAKDLVNAGFSDADLQKAGFDDKEIEAANLSNNLPNGVSISDIRNAGCSPQAIAQLREKGVDAKTIMRLSGCSVKALKAGGYTATELAQAGVNNAQLAQAGFSPDEIDKAGMTLPTGISVSDIRKAGCSPDALNSLRKRGVSAALIKKISGCDAKALKAAGFSASNLKDAGFSDEALKDAGFSEEELAAAKMGLPSGITSSDIKKAGCDPLALNKLRKQGVTAKMIKKITGCSAKALKEAGFSAADLKDAGFSNQDLVDAGYNAADLKRAGLSDADLAAAGFSKDEIAAANIESQLPSGVSIGDIKDVGCSPVELQKLRLKGVTADTIKKLNGCSAAALKAAGYDALALKNAGFTPEQLAQAGFGTEDISAANLGVKLPKGVSINDIKAAGCSPDALRKLKEKGVSAKAILKLSGCSVAALKEAGFDASELKRAGVTDAQLKAAGFTEDEIEKAKTALPPGVTMNDIRQAGCSPEALQRLRKQGVSAALIKKVSGCSATELKAAGYNAADLKEAGFSDQALKDAGFSENEITAAKLGLPEGVSLSDIKKAGCSPAALRQLRAQGVTAEMIKKISGCSAKALKDAGYSANELKQAGFSNKDLKDAGYSALDLKKAGLSDDDLADLGFSKDEIAAANIDSQLPAGVSISDVKNAGCSPQAISALREKGVSAEMIKKISGCSAAQLKVGGYNAAELKDAGFSYDDLAQAGFSPDEIQAANLGVSLPNGISMDDIKQAGCSPEALADLRSKGVSAKAILKISGCSPSALKNAGYSASDLVQAGLSNAQLKSAGFSDDEIEKAAMALPPGVSMDDIKKAGCSPEALARLRKLGVSAQLITKVSGCDANQLKAAGFDATALKDAGFSDAQLAAAGFSPVEIEAASLGLPAGVSLDEIRRAGCQPSALRQLRDSGVSAEMIKKISGCSVNDLKAAGYGADELLNAGFTPDQLKAAGFSQADISKALANNAGSSADTGIELPEGITEDDVRNAGCSPEALKQLRESGLSAKAILKISGCAPSALKAAGFNATDLMQAGLSDAQLKAAGFSEDEIAKAKVSLPPGVSISDIQKAGCSPEALAKLREKGVSALMIKKVSGCSADALKAAGFTATQLKDAGFSDNELAAAGFNPDEIAAANLGLPEGVGLDDLKAAGCSPEALAKLRAKGVTAEMIVNISGCSAKDLKKAGFDAQALKQAGFTDKDLADAGFTAAELKKAGLSDQQLKDAGFSDADIKAANIENLLPAGVSVADIKAAGCSPEAIKKLREKGVSALAIRKISGCTAQALKAAGYDAADLVDAGFNYGDLSAAGFSPEEIKAGLMGIKLPKGLSLDDIRNAGCDVNKLRALRDQGVTADAIIKLSGCSIKDLKAAGFSAGDLKQAGISDAQLKEAGFSQKDIDAAAMGLPSGITEDDILKAGCSPEALQRLRAKGVSAALIKKLSNCSAEQLAKAGFNATQLKEAGFNDSDLGAASFTPDDIQAANLGLPAGVSVNNIFDAECRPDALAKLRQQGVTAAQIKKLTGCSAKQLQAAGYSASDLLDAGFTAPAIAAAGFSAKDIEAANLGLPTGISAADVKNAGCDPLQLAKLRQQGVTASSIIKLSGCSPRALKQAGFTAADLLKAGITPAQLGQAGFSQADIEAGQALAPDALSQLRKEGCTVEAIQAAKAAGLSAAEIRKIAGCSASKLEAAGFSPNDLKDAGFTAAELKNSGIPVEDLRKAGFSANELKSAGVPIEALKKAGFDAKGLKEAGVSLQDLADAGFSAKALKQAGATQADLKDLGMDDSFASGLPGLGSVNAKDKVETPTKTAVNTATVPQAKKTDLLAGIESAANPAADKLSVIEANNKKLEQILEKQQERLNSQRYQQKIQKAAAAMSGAASKAIATWNKIPSQSFVWIGEPASEKEAAAAAAAAAAAEANAENDGVLVKAGDIMFAVLDTSVNSDEPGPVLATVVTGRFKGGKLIGSFSLPSNAEKIILSFDRLSLKSASKTVSINAIAIDPETARTALASRVNNHYLLRYGSLFASSFLTGVGASVASQGNSITVNGTDISVTQGLSRSALQSAILGLAEVGRQWGTQAQQLFNTPPTVELFSGTGMGIMFTQDIKSID